MKVEEEEQDDDSIEGMDAETILTGRRGSHG